MVGGGRRAAAAAVAGRRLLPLAAVALLLALAPIEPVQALGFEVLDGGCWFPCSSLPAAGPAATSQRVARGVASWQCGHVSGRRHAASCQQYAQQRAAVAQQRAAVG